MTLKRWAALAGLVVVVAVAAALSVRLIRPQQGGIDEGAPAEKVALRFYKDPSPVPAVTMQDLQGRTISPADLRGKVVIVNFWATWCPPCRAEIPDLVALQSKYADKVQVIGVSQDEGSIEGVKRFAAAQKMNYPIVMSTTEIERAFPGIAALPTSFIVDREGRIVQRHVGMLNARYTEQEARALAGLSVNATIEKVDRAQPAKLENAQATQIPGIDLSRLSPERRTQALQKLNTDPCTCGCDNTVAKCRIDDPKCGTSLPLAQRIVHEIAEQP